MAGGPTEMAGTLDRRAVVEAVLVDRPDGLLVVTGLGSPTWDVAATGDRDDNFYLWAAMGSAVPIGLGLAIARPDRRILVVTGDGEMLMGLGSLATAGIQQPPNLAVLVLDNQVYGETGGQDSHTAGGVDLCAVARSCRFAETVLVRAENALADLRSFLLQAPGPVFAVAKIAAGEPPRVLPPRDGHALRARFRNALAARSD